MPSGLGKKMFRNLFAQLRRLKHTHDRPLGSAASRLAELFDGRPATVVQIGSNDGIQGDPITALIRRNPQWNVLFVEPLPHIFSRLVQNYKGYPNFRFQNSAIAETDGVKEFFYVSDEITQHEVDIPYWYDQIGSFNKAHIPDHGDVFEKYMKSIEINCKTLRQLLTSHHIENIDVLHIDAEGYDFEILKQVDFEICPPRSILYEFMHLQLADDMEAVHTLVKHGYQVQRVLADVLAIRQSTQNETD